MIITKLEEYWILCKIYRRAVDFAQRKLALDALRGMDRRAVRFVDLEPKVTVRVKGDADGDGPAR